jgi:hypothetical protein
MVKITFIKPRPKKKRWDKGAEKEAFIKRLQVEITFIMANEMTQKHKHYALIYLYHPLEECFRIHINLFPDNRTFTTNLWKVKKLSQKPKPIESYDPYLIML